MNSYELSLRRSSYFSSAGGGESLRRQCMRTLDGGLMPRGWAHAER